jgi:hypothetical protein
VHSWYVKAAVTSRRMILRAMECDVRSLPSYVRALGLVFLWLLYLAGIASVHGETRITREGEVITLEVEQASLQEALSALANVSQTRLRSALPLTDSVQGRYDGPLLRIVAILLRRYNYYIRTANGVEIVVLGPRQKIVAQQPRAAPSQAPAGLKEPEVSQEQDHSTSQPSSKPAVAPIPPGVFRAF